MESTSSPKSVTDDILEYLKPIVEVLDSEEIFDAILKENTAKVFASINFEGQKFTEKQLKIRLSVYQDLLNHGEIG